MMTSVPGAVATGSRPCKLRSLEHCDLVATAPGTDLLQALQEIQNQRDCYFRFLLLRYMPTLIYPLQR